MQNNPIRYNDPSGHWLVEDYGNGGCSTSGYCPGSSDSTYTPTQSDGDSGNNGGSEHEHSDPDDILSGDAGGGINESNEALNSFLDVIDNYNYSVGSNNITLYQYYSWMFDIEISGQFGIIYSNNSSKTIGLSPRGLNLRHTFYRSNDGFSMNFNLDPSLGYAQSLPHSAISSVTGINVNPITGAVNSRFVVGLDGPLSYQQSVSIKATVRPMESTLATIAGGVMLLAAIPGPVDEGVVVYVACKFAGAC